MKSLKEMKEEDELNFFGGGLSKDLWDKLLEIEERIKKLEDL